MDLQSPAFFFHGKGCIGGEVHEYLLHLCRGCDDCVRRRLDTEIYLNIGRDGCPEKLHRLFDNRSQGQGGPLIIGLPAECEDLLHKVPRP